MQISSITQSAVNGINQAQKMASEAANNIAHSTNITESIVQLEQAKTVNAANAQVLKTSNEMLGTLIDITV